MSQPSTPPALEREVFAVHIRQRKRLRLVIQRNDSDNRIRSGALPRETEAVVRACHFADHIRAAVRAVELHKLLRVLGRDGQHIRIVLAHKAQPRRIGVTDDDPVRVMQHGAQHGADAVGPAPRISTVSPCRISEILAAQ